jgi:hypothetical protein
MDRVRVMSRLRGVVRRLGGGIVSGVWLRWGVIVSYTWVWVVICLLRCRPDLWFILVCRHNPIKARWSCSCGLFPNIGQLGTLGIVGAVVGLVETLFLAPQKDEHLAKLGKARDRLRTDISWGR